MRRLSIFLIILFLPQAAIAQTRTVIASKSFKLHWAYATNPDCSSSGDVVIRVVSPPSNGRISIARGGVVPDFPPSNVRSECNQRRVPCAIVISIVDERISFGSLPRGAEPTRFAAQYDNREVLRGYFKELLEQWSMNFYNVTRFVAENDVVVLQDVCSWTHKGTGKTCETPKVDIWRFRDGKAVEFYEMFDTAAAFAAATP